MALFRKNKNDKVVVILDIGSASVGAAAVSIGTGKKLEVISWTRKPVNFLFDINLDASLRCTLSAVSQSLKKVYGEFIRSDNFKKPDYVLCVFSSPWFISQTKEVSRKESAPFEVSSEALGKILEEEGKIFKDSHPIFSGNDPKKRAEIMEHSFMKVELNGYQTDQPIGKMAKTLKSSLYISLGLKDAIDKFKKEIEKFFPHLPLYFKTMPYVTFGVLSSLTNTGRGFCVVNVGGETTDLYVIRDSYIEETITFPRGANNFFRKLSSRFKITPREAVSMLYSVLRGHRMESDYIGLEKVADESEKEWADFFEKALRRASESRPVPPHIFLMSGDILSPSFRDAIGSDKFSAFTDTGKPFKAVDINGDWFKPHMEIEKNGKKTGINSDDTLMMELFFAKKIF